MSHLLDLQEILCQIKPEPHCSSKSSFSPVGAAAIQPINVSAEQQRRVLFASGVFFSLAVAG